ncbi:hypothetical protein EV426DRAFT_706418 [Tirmania nivea]|nr:hypothetical protein EV426DRAFT_706418 [Tirmania nivea]
MLPTIFKKILGGMLIESKEEKEDLDTDDEAEIDGCGREQKKERLNSMNHGEWKLVALCLLGNMVSLVGGEGASESTNFNYVQAILGEEGSRDGYLTELDDAQNRETELYREIGILTDQALTVVMLNKAWRDCANLKEEVRKLKAYNEAREREMDLLVEEAESKWKQWAEKEIQVKAGKVVAAERKKWQSEGKGLPIEVVTSAAQTDQTIEDVKVRVEAAIQTEVEIGKRGASNSEDVVMRDGSNIYEDLSGYDG